MASFCLHGPTKTLLPFSWFVWTFELKNGLKIKDDRQNAVQRARTVDYKKLARISVGRNWLYI